MTRLFLLFTAASISLIGQNSSAWRSDPEHRQLKYRVACSQGSATVDWRNDYPREVSVKANVTTAIYNGSKQVRLAPGGTAQNRLETMDCAPVRVAVTKVVAVGNTPLPPPRRAAAPTVKSRTTSKRRVTKRTLKSRSKPRLKPRTRPAAPLKSARQAEPEFTTETLGSTRIGMTPDQVLSKLGAPSAKITMPDEDQVVQIFSYRAPNDKMAAVYFTNGKVSQIRPPH